MYALWQLLVVHDRRSTHAAPGRGGTGGGFAILREVRGKKERKGTQIGRKGKCFSMQMATFIRCAIILIISYSDSSS